MKDEAKPGKIVISKSVTGSINKVQAEKVISLIGTINSTKEVNTYSLKDFNYDESNKKWTKELIQVAGGYKVEELVTSIKGHKLSLTQYQINENCEIKEKVTDKIAEKVTVKKDKTTFIEFENNYDLNVFDVEIDKTDISGTKEVDGAKLKVIDEEGNLVERWISVQDNEKTHKLKLSPGKYTLIEEEAPYGYRVADPIDFTVNENGKIEGMSENKITMKDEKTQAKLIHTKTIEGDILKKDAQKITFKVNARRARKNYPLASMEINGAVGEAILDAFPDIRVDVHHPDVMLNIEIRQVINIYSETIPGPGGMPVGTAGKGMLLLSGGIDSPVAGYMIAKRGVSLEAVYFHTPPYTSERAKQKVLDLAKKVAAYSGPVKLNVVNFTDIKMYINEQNQHE